MSILNPEAPEFFPCLSSAVKDGYAQMTKTVVTSNKFPTGFSYNLINTNTNFIVLKAKMSENVIKQSNQILLKHVSLLKLRCEGDDEGNTDKLIDANDSLLDQININIDTLNGVNQPNEAFINNVQPASSSRSPALTTIKVKRDKVTTTVQENTNIPRPQMYFKEPVDNSDQIFLPRIHEKPNSIKPLSLRIIYNEEGKPVGYQHPYKVELQMYVPPAFTMKMDEPPTLPPSLEATPLTIVETEAQLDQLIKHLDQVQEIAVDLEHHAYRTYQGITCLIQISTDEGGDFIVDALSVREHLHKLNHSFTDPRKVKVFHGAEHDVRWLQRDFGVFLVGLFDTHQAARLLRYTELSLKSLLKRYCDVDTNKMYQLSDWRVRPLPDELIKYARLDTHYLLYIYRCMRMELLKGNPSELEAVFQKSTQICGLTYQKKVLDEESHMPLYIHSRRYFSSAQMAALCLLYRWRDQQARQLDESVIYVLPNYMMIALAQTLPKEVQGINAVCNPMPPIIKQNIHEVHQIILTCRDLADKPQLFSMPAGVMEMMEPRPVDQSHLHELSQSLFEPSENPVNVDRYWVNLSAKYAGRSDFWDEAMPFEYTTASLNNRETSAPTESNKLNSEAKMFVPPFHRYKIYRVATQAEEFKEYEKMEAKIGAISGGKELIKEVLAKFRVVYVEKDKIETQKEGEDLQRMTDEPETSRSQAPEEPEATTVTQKIDVNTPIASTSMCGKESDPSQSNQNVSPVKPIYKNVNYSKFRSGKDKLKYQTKKNT